MPEYQAICEWCQKPFMARRKDARFCSDRCRKRAGKLRQAETRVDGIDQTERHPRVIKGTTTGEILEAIVTMKAIQATLSGAAMTASPGYRPLCRRLSEKIKTMLECEGL